jgi:hypothetical protein
VTRATLVSAADHQYYRTLCQLLLSAERHGVHTRCDVVAFDLGLNDGDRAHLRRRFHWCALERFAFDDYPPHVARLEICAWKPIAIEDVCRKRGGLVMWLDSATLVRASLDEAFADIARDGIVALVGQSPLPRWCHEATLRFMHVDPVHMTRRCRSAGVLGFDSGRADVRALVARWRELSLIPECIDPPGASRANHRYDQSVLNNLLAQFDADRGWADQTTAHGEVDISSVRPVTWVSTRNRVASWIPLACDPLVRAWYAIYKRADRAALAVRASLNGRAAVL